MIILLANFGKQNDYDKLLIFYESTRFMNYFLKEKSYFITFIIKINIIQNNYQNNGINSPFKIEKKKKERKTIKNIQKSQKF